MSWTSRFRGLLQSQNPDQDVDEELSAHIDMRTRDNIASGMTPRKPVKTRGGDSATSPC